MIDITYTLNQNDFVQLMLYNANQSTYIKQQRKKTGIIIGVALIVIAVGLYDTERVIAFELLGMSIISFIFYPLYQRKQYRTHYQKMAVENFGPRFGKPSHVVINELEAVITDPVFELKILLADLKKIAETGEYFFVYFTTSGCIIIPKNVVAETQTFQSFFQSLTKQIGVNFTYEPGWKFR